VIADDAVLFREGVARLMNDAGLDVVGQAADAAGLLALIERIDAGVDVAVIDVRMPPSHTAEGLEAASTIRRRWPGIGTLVLSQYVETHQAMELLAEGRGRTGYLLKDRVSDVEAFVEAVRRVGEGGSVVDPEVIARLLERRRAVDPLAALSPREREILAMIAEGRSNRAIAASLHVTDNTLETHIGSLFAKLGLQPDPDENRRVLAALTYLRS
jgi:serine/threonine-protein kinase